MNNNTEILCRLQAAYQIILRLDEFDAVVTAVDRTAKNPMLTGSISAEHANAAQGGAKVGDVVVNWKLTTILEN